MRTYVVQAGDSPARIAARDAMAGCPKCSVDLIRANAHKPVIKHPNGFLSFRELRVGETLWLPDKWFSGELDELPPEYFAALPHPDGVTPTAVQATVTTTAPAGIVGEEAPPKKEGLSKGAIVGLSLLAAGVVGGVIYLAAFEGGKPRVRRVSPCPNRKTTLPRPRKRPKYAQRTGWHWDPCYGWRGPSGEKPPKKRRKASR